MKNLLIAIIAVAGFSFATPFANATDDALIVKIFAEAIDDAEHAESNSQVDTQGTMQPQAIPAVGPLLRIVFTYESARFLLDAWDHIVSNWEFYRRMISDESGRIWFSSCSVDSSRETSEGREVMLRCSDRPSSLRSESE